MELHKCYLMYACLLGVMRGRSEATVSTITGTVTGTLEQASSVSDTDTSTTRRMRTTQTEYAAAKHSTSGTELRNGPDNTVFGTNQMSTGDQQPELITVAVVNSDARKTDTNTPPITTNTQAKNTDSATETSISFFDFSLDGIGTSSLLLFVLGLLLMITLFLLIILLILVSQVKGLQESLSVMLSQIIVIERGKSDLQRDQQSLSA